MIKSTIVKLSVVALSLGLMAGCATTQMQADIAKAQETADAAMATASSAKRVAASADRRASAVMDAANAAQATADECAERCGRMMQKAMSK